MSESSPIPLQQSLFDGTDPSFDSSFSTLERLQLDEDSWVDLAQGWVHGSERLFQEILSTRKWAQRTRWMYEKRVLEPRLTAYWHLHAGAPLEPALLDQMRLSLSARYGVLFDSVGFNLYRDGQDAVAWHGDKISKEIAEPIVALVSVGQRRRLLLRPKGGGKSRAFSLGEGDLFVTGGKAQRKWEHSVPRVAHAGPRISIAFRHGMEPSAYGTQAVR